MQTQTNQMEDKCGLKFAITIMAAIVALLLAVALSGCSSDENENVPEELKSDTGLTGGVAATVNGTEIEEDKVTRAINNMRLNYSLTEDDEWKDYLKRQKYTVESMRYEVLGQLIDQELVKQCADQRGVTTDDEEIQSYVDKMKNQYSSEEAWLNAVDESGWDDEDAYKEALRFSILEKKLQDGYKDETDSALQGQALLDEIKDKKATYDKARRSSHILIKSDNEELANEIKEKLDNGEMTFEDAVAEYSIDDATKEKNGDVGWDKVETLDSDYQSALDKLDVGEISEVTKTKYGYHIITCTDIWNAPEEINSASEVPDEILADIRTKAIDTKGDEAYKDWLNSERASNSVEFNKMPDNVPYYVDMSDEYSEEEMAEINDKAERELVGEIVDEEENVTTTEAADESAASDDAAAAAATETE